MMPRLVLLATCLGLLAACDPGPNGLGTAPPGVSQAEHDAQVAARNKARRTFYSGPRGGASGR